MKVIIEIIDYLLDENIITKEDFRYLQSKGFYKGSVPHDYSGCTCPSCIAEYYYYEEIEDAEKLENESIETQVALDLEAELEDTRRRKLGKKGKFYSGKSKKYGNRQAKKKLRYFHVSGENISQMQGKIPKQIISEIEKLKGNFYNSFTKFSMDLKKILPINEQDNLKLYYEIIKANITRKYKIPHYIKKEDGFYITPRTFFNMKKNPVIINTIDYELYILVSGDKKIQLTNKEGKIIQPISLKKY